MAVLSKNGTELARVRIEVKNVNVDVVKRITEYSLRSNGKVLKHLVTHFAPNQFSGGKTRRHDYGWKVAEFGTTYSLKREPTPQEVEAWVKKMEEHGYKKV